MKKSGTQTAVRVVVVNEKNVPLKHILTQIHAHAKGYVFFSTDIVFLNLFS